MIPSVEHKVSPLAIVRRAWMETIIRPLTLGVLVLVFAVGVDTGLPKSSLKVPDQPPENHQRQTKSPSLLAAAMQSSDHLEHRQLPSALMTGHILTSAHVVTHRDVIQLSRKTKDNPKKGQ